MANQYQHRIGVRAEICLDLVHDERDLSPAELSQLIAQVLKNAADTEDGGFKLNAVPGGVVYPDWNSVDPEVDPDRVLDPSAIRTFDCTEIGSIH